jgi:hypothetical protein
MAIHSLRPLRELALLLGHRRGGRPTHVTTLTRWHRVGLKGKTLPLTRVGGVWMGTEADLWAFIMATQPSQSPEAAPAFLTTATADLESIERQLAQDKW